MTEIRKRLIIIILYLLPFIVTVFSVMFQKTGILSGGPGSRICFIGELAALLFSGVFIFLREIKTESCSSISAKTKIFCSVMLYLLFMSLLFLAGEAFVLLSEDIKLGDIESSDDCTIHFRYKNGQWTVEPESLINQEPPKIPSAGKPNER